MPLAAAWAIALLTSAREPAHSRARPITVARGMEARRRRARRRGVLWSAALAVAVACVVVPAIALAAFPGTNPAESPRANPPNDPGYDSCELDAEDTCSTYGDEDYRLFGFSPDSALVAPGFHTPTSTARSSTSRAATPNALAGDPQCSQIGGVRADTAWKYSTGDPSTAIAILDTGIRWQERDLVDKIHLNAAELPTPQHADGTDCSSDDCNNDGAFNVEDYLHDPRVAITAGDSESDDILDASDLIATFSDDTDADANGYVDDIAGWDFFDDDNDPFDASSCCSADGHGSGRAQDAVGRGRQRDRERPACARSARSCPCASGTPSCVPGDNYAMARHLRRRQRRLRRRGGDRRADATRAFARERVAYADRRGVALMLVSSDINTANHNYPTNYNEAIYVGGSIYDTAPNKTCWAPVACPGVGRRAEPARQLPGRLRPAARGAGAAADAASTPTSQPTDDELLPQLEPDPVRRQGGHRAHGLDRLARTPARRPAPPGCSRPTRASSFRPADPADRQRDPPAADDDRRGRAAGEHRPDRPADKANPGWDPHFGYGRVDLAAAMKRITTGEIPPEAQIDTPDWFAPIDVDRVAGQRASR